MTRPMFLDLDGAAIAELRGSSSVSTILDWLKWERTTSADAALVLLANGDDTKARLHANAVQVLDHIIARINTPAPLADFDDEPYKDPARRPTRKDSDAEAR